MIKVALRYYQKEQKYLVEIKGPQYFELDKQLKRIAREYDCISHTDSEKKPILEKKRIQLRNKRLTAIQYFWIAEGDVPSDIPARPIHILPPKVEYITGERYQNIISALRK